MDLTGSMGPYFGVTRARARDITTILTNEGKTPETAIIAYGDYLGSVYSWSSDYNTIISNINSAYSDEGGDQDENHVGAIYYAVHNFLFDPETNKYRKNVTFIQTGNAGSRLNQFPYKSGPIIDIPTLQSKLNDDNHFYICIYQYYDGGAYNLASFPDGLKNGLYIPLRNNPTGQYIVDLIKETFK